MSNALKLIEIEALHNLGPNTVQNDNEYIKIVIGYTQETTERQFFSQACIG